MSDVPQDAKSIFLAALDVADPAERAALVRRLCGDDRALLQRVDDLLRAYGESGGPLDKMAAALAPTQLGQPIREQVGSTIGPYKLMEQIGEGGFGLVFVAEQQQPIRRKVALKIIKPGMDTRDVIARFEAERQALALMDHPNIARVLDAGTTESGRPYFVMELVRGIPITEYCDQAQLTPRERLELFVPVCNAIQHAHLKGIIHRDVKPSNVLITLHDDRPVVKVIDFGVAKALYQPLTDRTIYTRYAQMIGTPLYMSPEQAQMSGLDIDTRSDIYSLGVLLYELLTGSTPFNKERLAKAAYDELLKIIREEEPPKPSVRLSQSTDTLPSIAAQRKTEPAKLSKMFSGDLDWIAMKALEKDRKRRYETANAFAADVLRYLNDEPVEASPPSAGYRIRKFARKHRKPVIAVAMIAGVLLLGIFGTTWGLFRARQAEQAAIAERDRAERQFAIGLLRPIGFSFGQDFRRFQRRGIGGVVSPFANPDRPVSLKFQFGSPLPELQSFIDWSAITDARLKLRVLELALEDPTVALRVAGRAERVIQACVGVSPARRAEAIKLVFKKQRDRAADPRNRVAACWLALELGSTDIPAWEESCSYLSDPKNGSLDRFDDFATLAMTRSDSRQVDVLNPEPLIALLELSANSEVKGHLCHLLGDLAPRLRPSQTNRVLDVLLGASNRSLAIGDGFRALGPRLDQVQVRRAGDLLVGMLEKSSDSSGPDTACPALIALSDRFEAVQITRIAESLAAMLDKSPQLLRNFQFIGALSTFATQLTPQTTQRAGETLISVLEKSADIGPACEGLAALGPRLDPRQMRRAGDTAIARLESSTDCYKWATALEKLAPRLEAEQMKRAAEALIQKLATPAHADRACMGLKVLAPRLETEQRSRAAEIVITKLEKSGSYGAYQVLAEFAPRLGPQHARRAAGILIASLKKGSLPDLDLDECCKAIVVLAPQLTPAQRDALWDSLTGIIDLWDTSDQQWPTDKLANAIAVLAARLGPAQSTLRSRRLVDDLEKPRASHWHLVNVLTAVAPQLERTLFNRMWNDMVSLLKHSTNDDDLYAVAVGLPKLASRLEPANRDTFANQAVSIFLDVWSLRDPDGQGAPTPATSLSRSLSSPRSVATLLSHPGCVDQERRCFLERFEEIVLYDGKPVFYNPDAADADLEEQRHLPPRRFRTLYDAAAWIQQNWPDFDLETNCPVTWRGSR